MNIRLILLVVAAVILVGAIAVISFTGTPGDKVPQIVNTPPAPQPVAPIKNSGIIPQPVPIATSSASATSSPTITTKTPMPPSPLTQPATPLEFKIDIQNFAFAPNETRVTKGTKITWTNRDSVQHNVISDTGIFSGPLLSQGQSYSTTLNTPGTYTYHCGPHPNMKGEIIVE